MLFYFSFMFFNYFNLCYFKNTLAIKLWKNSFLKFHKQLFENSRLIPQRIQNKLQLLTNNMQLRWNWSYVFT